MMLLIISGGMSPSVLTASLLGSGLMKYKVGRPLTCNGILEEAVKNHDGYARERERDE